MKVAIYARVSTENVGDHAKVKFFEPAFIFVGTSSARVTLGFPWLGLVLNSESSNGLGHPALLFSLDP